jgi:hypothetical protein
MALMCVRASVAIVRAKKANPHIPLIMSKNSQPTCEASKSLLVDITFSIDDMQYMTALRIIKNLHIAKPIRYPIHLWYSGTYASSVFPHTGQVIGW